MRFVFAVVGLIACQAVAAQAGSERATLEVIQGSAYVTTDHGLELAETGNLLAAGQKIVLKDKSTAILSNAETGCFISLREAGTYDVPDMSGCASGSAAVLKAGFQVTPTNGVLVQPPPPTILTLEPELMGLGFFGTVSFAATYNYVTEELPISGS